MTPPKYLTAEEQAALPINEAVILAPFRFQVISRPGDDDHPALWPPPELWLVEVDYNRMFLDRRGRR